MAGGRPSKLTPEVQARIVAALRVGATHAIAAAHGGVDVATLQRWLASSSPRYREFRDAARAASAKGDVVALSTVATAAQTDWRAAMRLLEARHPEAYGRRVQVQAMPVQGVDADLDAQASAARRGIGIADAAVLWQRQMQVTENAFLAGRLSEAAYLSRLDRLASQAARLAELGLKDTTAPEVPALALTFRLDSPHVQQPAPPPAGVAEVRRLASGGDAIDVG
jgi:hypothetical protein